jgi:hypothetical protein
MDQAKKLFIYRVSTCRCVPKLVRYAAINGCQEDRCPKSKRMGQNVKNINPQLAFNIA